MIKNSRYSLFFVVGITASLMLRSAVYAQNNVTLLDAASKNDVATVRRLLDSKIAVNDVKDANGWTALITATRNGAMPTAKLLLERGANPNTASKTGYTPLIAAAEFGDPAVIRLLLLHGADPNKATPRGLTPLMMAAANKFGPKSEAKDLECIKALLLAGADPDAKHQSGSTALSVAENRKATKIVAYLRRISGSGGVTAVATTSPIDGKITGTVSYREKMALSPAAFAVVRLLNITTKTPTVIAQSVTLFQGTQVPLAFALSYKPSDITGKPGARFALDARIVSGGTVLFRTNTVVPTLTASASGKNVSLVLAPAGNAMPTLTAEAIEATDDALAQGGTTITGHRVSEESDAHYTASFLSGKLVRIVATTSQGNYGMRTDRFYFGENVEKGYPALRAAYLSARRLARANPPLGATQTTGTTFTGSYEQVKQTLILGDDGMPVVGSKLIDNQKRTVSEPDVIAARNFAHLFISDLYKQASKKRR